MVAVILALQDEWGSMPRKSPRRTAPHRLLALPHSCENRAPHSCENRLRGGGVRRVERRHTRLPLFCTVLTVACTIALLTISWLLRRPLRCLVDENGRVDATGALVLGARVRASLLPSHRGDGLQMLHAVLERLLLRGGRS